MKSKLGAFALIGFSLLALIGLLVAKQYFSPPKLDPVTGCGAEVSAKTVILLDLTDDISEQTKTEIRSRVGMAIEKRVSVGELVSVFYVDDLSKRKLAPAFTYCKPKMPSQANILIESEKLIDKIYRDKFFSPLNQAIATQFHGAKESPIAQAIVDLSLLSQLSDAKKSQLLIYSDMIEYTSRFSMYRCSDARAAITAYKASKGSSVARPSFKNLSVEINIIPRANISRDVGLCRDGFWAWFFGDISGRGGVVRKDLPG